MSVLSSVLSFHSKMLLRKSLISNGLVLLPAFVALSWAQLDENAGIRVAKQATARNGLQDQNSAETGFGGGGGGIENSKYFHYQHLPEHDKYEFGYRRGNDHHVKERYEKAIPHEGHFKTKVRWADHKGGHGEHYWDYNHAGHGGDDGEGGYSDPVPTYTDSQNANTNDSPRVHQKRQSEAEASRRAFKASPTEALPPQSANTDAAGFLKAFEDEIGGIQNFDYQRESSKQKRAPQSTAVPAQRQAQNVKPSNTDSALKTAAKAGQEIQKNGTPQLFFDLESGKVIDENTGKTYLLQPAGN